MSEDRADVGGNDTALALLKRRPDARIVSDAKGKITFWNAGAARTFGFDAAHATSRSLDLIVPENLRAALVRL